MVEMAFTKTQRGLARHALGLPNKRKMTYRNHFVTGEGSTDYPHWMAMVDMGAAQRRYGSRCRPGEDVLFHLTRAGAEMVLNDDEKLCPEDFPKEPRT